jgi:pimeloyl-ACP methyl ester carboxylesterase
MKQFKLFFITVLFILISSFYSLSLAGSFSKLEGDLSFSATGLNNSGQLIAGNSLYSLTAGYLGPVFYPGSQATWPTAMSNDGQIVGVYWDANGGSYAFLLSGGQYTTLSIPTPSGINNSGDIVGSFYDPNTNQEHGFLYSGGVSTTLDYPGSTSTFVTGINDMDQIVGYYDSNGSQHGFLISSGQFTTIDFPGKFRTLIYGINNLGQMVGGYEDDIYYGVNTNTGFGAFTHGFLYAGGVFTTLDFPDPTADPNPDPSNGYYDETTLYSINDLGQIIGYFNYQDYDDPSSYFLISPSDLVDPIPALTNELSSSTPNFSNLSVNGTPVQGVSADGVAEILVRIPTNSASDQFTVSIINDQRNVSGNTDEDGTLIPVGRSWCNNTPGTICAQSTGNAANSYFAFVLYRAPKDFVRLNNSVDPGLDHRRVNVKIASSQTYQVPITIVRPPVELVHGLWGSIDSWMFFMPVLQNIPGIYIDNPINYKSTNYLGFQFNAPNVLDALRQKITSFKSKNLIAAVQADVIAHSMGGDIIRTFRTLPSYNQENNFYNGEVHKLITIDTPHNGSPLANNLYNSNSVCKAFFQYYNKPISDAVRDLIPDSPALQAIANPSASPFPLQTHLLAGKASPTQEQAAEYNYQNLYYGLFQQACPSLLSDPTTGDFIGFEGVLGSSDLIVPVLSQKALFPSLGFNGNIVPYDLFDGYIHAADPLLFNVGPDVLDRNISIVDGSLIPADDVIPNATINLLNTSILNNSVYGPILP